MAGSDITDAVSRFSDRVSTWRKGSAIWGLDTGIAGINRALGGLQTGLTILGARPSHGKTALAFQIAVYVAESIYRRTPVGQSPDEKVVIFSPEMSEDDLLERFVAMKTGISINALRRGEASDEEYAAAMRAAEYFADISSCYILDTDGGESFEDMVSILDDMYQESRVGGPRIALAIFDHLQRLRLSTFVPNETREVTIISDRLKDVSNKYRIPILVTSQLSRSIERDKRYSETAEREPDMSDLRFGGEMAADVIMLLWNPRSDDEGDSSTLDAVFHRDASLNVVKGRNVGVSRIRLEYYPALTKFVDHPSELRRLAREKKKNGVEVTR